MVATFLLAKQVLSILAFALVANAIAVPKVLEARNEAGFVALDFDVVKASPEGKEAAAFFSGRRLFKKSNVPVGLLNQGDTYAALVKVGSNKQEVLVSLDTGSSDFWVVDADAVCQAEVECKNDGVFNTSDSSTWQDLSSEFYIEYGDGTTSQGTWGKDSVELGGVTINGQQFGDVTNTSSVQGVLGIGYRAFEVNGADYDNVPLSLKNQGAIATNAYSLYLNEPGAKTGSIIFGGVDHEKYYGELSLEPITHPGVVPTIALSDITYDGTTAVSNNDQSVLLDSGTTVTYLTPSVASQIAAQAGAYWVDSADGGYYAIPCHADLTGNVTYAFAHGAEITVPLSEFVYANDVSANDGTNNCGWGIQPQLSEPQTVGILGANFLRHAYLVYNLDLNTISLAPVRYTTASNITSV
ncbi:uncharacterized protein LODBEIA_P39680 [Lodderomyces beijingensis]|uniref:candidapepsin n=1 Tax=Lodderomyces beijingensis TaxID=1775926 RepID=A0ABP0ZNM1_9ASCO